MIVAGEDNRCQWSDVVERCRINRQSTTHFTAAVLPLRLTFDTGSPVLDQRANYPYLLHAESRPVEPTNFAP